MKRYITLILVLLMVIGTAFAQGIVEDTARSAAPVPTANPDQSGGSPVTQMDQAIAALVRGMHGRLTELKAQKIAVGQFPYQGSNTPLAVYWINQLSGALTNTPGRSYTILSGGLADAEWTISGEIVLLPGIIRVYTRLVRVENRAIEAVFNADFERSTALAAMLSSSDSGRSSSQSIPDELEPDDWENPVVYEAGANEQSATVMNRTIHREDEDFFLLVPEQSGRLVAETTGSIDTYMYLYDYESREQLASNDDGGSGDNARIRHNVLAGIRYLVKVRGYSSSTNGSYGFRAYVTVSNATSGWENPIAYTIGAGDDSLTVNRSIERGDVGDYFLLIPDRAGQVTMETTGSTDTYMELYDEETRRRLASNDDSGSGTNARIRHRMNAGTRYIVLVRGYEESDSGSYGFRAFFGEGMIAADIYEPNDDSSQAKPIEIGTPQEHTFHHAEDVDWVTFQVTQPRRYTITAKGVRTAQLDTYIELFDSDINSIDGNDDGGENLDARLSVYLQNGLYYLKAGCLDSDPDQAYIIKIE